MPEMIRMLKDPDRGVRVNAVYALGPFGTLDGSIVPLLINALKGKEAALHAPAVRSLGKIKTDDAMRGLIEGLRNKDREVRNAAMGAFRSIGRPAVPTLTKALQDNDPVVAERAAEALRQIKGG